MQKFTAILEKNVEWFALGIGGLFFLWMIYGYVVQKPVTAPLGSELVAPGEVDPKILAGPARELQRKMDEPSVPPMVVVEFNKDLNDQLSGKTMEVTALQYVFVGPANPAGRQIVTPVQQPPGGVVVQVSALPQPPAPIDLKFSQGRSNVQIPALPGAVAGPPGQAVGTDRNWVSVSSLVAMKPLAQEFADKKIPPLLNTTTLLRLELVREEQGPVGDWGNQKVIDPLPNVVLQPMPPAVAVPNQPPNLFVDQANVYKDFAEKNQKILLQPDFYQVLQADPWLVPGQLPTPSVLLVEEPFDPAKVRDFSKMTEEQKKIYREYRRQEDERKRLEQAERYRQRNPSRTPPGGGGPPGGGYRPPPPGAPDLRSGALRGFSPAPIDDQRPLTLAQAYRPGGPPLDPMFEVDQFTNTQPGQATPPGAPPIGPLPQGSFDPAVLSAGAPLPAPPIVPGAPPVTIPNPGDITTWAHDDTVQPGHTYRYKMRYLIRNPVFASRGACNPQTLADTFILASEFSAWSNPIAVKSETNFYAIGTSPTGSNNVKAKFEIFRWKNGNWQMQTVEVTPGDMVGTPQGAGATQVDFTTGLTLVDVRPDPKNPENRIIILSGDNGQLVRHDLSADRANEEYKKLRDQAINAAKPVAAAGGAAP